MSRRLASISPLGRRRVRLSALLAMMIAAFTASSLAPGLAAEARRDAHYPMVPEDHRHLRLLLDNAFEYLAPDHGLIDPVSGYPAEGWNQEPERRLFLRSFTQLTAIGAWIELLANIAAGYADNPYVSRDSALGQLALALATLRADQGNPDLAAKGLLVNFLSLENGERRGPLLESIERRRFIEAFGDREGEAIWLALVQKGWLHEEDQGRKGRIRRGEGYGANHFDGALAAYSAEPLRSRIMGLLDQRVLTIIFGDNVNLTAALAKAAGALLRPEIRDDPRAAELRAAIERIIDGQAAGYAHLFDAKTGTFFFGWDATADRFVGWDDGQGTWVTGQMNYLINEFRGPWMFAVLRYDLPLVTIRNAGLKIKPYRHGDGRDTYVLAAWEGSAFQLLGLSLFLQELRNPGWRESLGRLVDVGLDFSRRRGLPGLLTEAYSGRGTEYTGHIGIPDLAITDQPLGTESPSLYSLGVAYMIAPEPTERFLEANWPLISRLLTSHGPWEGWSTATNSPIPYQTTVHTLSLILGGIGSAQDNMRRYLDEAGLSGPLSALYAPGDRVDLLADANELIPWTSDQSGVELSRGNGAVRFASQLGGHGGLVFRVADADGVSLTNGRLVIGYAAASAIEKASITFKRAENDPDPPPGIPVEIHLRLRPGENERIEIVLPATPALWGIREVALTFGASGGRTPVDLALTAFDFLPFDLALDSPR